MTRRATSLLAAGMTPRPPSFPTKQRTPTLARIPSQHSSAPRIKNTTGNNGAQSYFGPVFPTVGGCRMRKKGLRSFVGESPGARLPVSVTRTYAACGSELMPASPLATGWPINFGQLRPVTYRTHSRKPFLLGPQIPHHQESPLRSSPRPGRDSPRLQAQPIDLYVL